MGPKGRWLIMVVGPLATLGENVFFNLISIRYKVTFFHNIKLKIEINYIYQSNEYQVTATLIQKQEQTLL